MASHLKIFNVVPELYPRLVQVSGGNLYDGNGNLITVIGQGGGSEGAQGFQGPTGPDGTVRNDSFSASVITITHSLGYYPVVQVINSGGEVVMPLSISHSSVNSFTVDFGTAFSGYVITGAGAVGVTGPQGTNGVLGGTGPTGPQGPTGPTPSLSQVLLQGNTASNSINMSNYPITSIDYLDFYTTTTASSSPGRLYWNDTDGTLNLGLKGGNVTLQIGQEEVVRVVNKSGENLLESEYKVVRVRLTSEGGAQGQRLAVVLAQADNDPDSATTLGVVTENITDNQEGFITISGLVNGINTTATSFHGESWSDGDILYLSSSVPGGMTNVKPTSPNHTVIVGFVVYAHPNNGRIFVKIDNGYELKELHDVYYTTPNNGDILQWSGTNSRWEAKTFTGGTGSGSGTTGAQGPIGPTGLGGTIANYGYFYDTTTQTNAGATAVNPMTFNTTDLSVGVSIVSNSRMTIANSGVYNIQFSAQIEKTDAGTDVIDIWLRKNGNDVVDSNGTIEISGAGAEYIAAWNYLVQSNANDYYEIVWSSADLNIRLLTTGTQSSPTRPAVPSVIASVTQVTYTQIGPTGSTGFQGSTGSQGPIGPQGNTGPQGETGPQGFQGETGPQGNQGNQGFTGPQGFQGTTGPQGETGVQGNQGPTGPTGSSGIDGVAGGLNLFFNSSVASDVVPYRQLSRSTSGYGQTAIPVSLTQLQQNVLVDSGWMTDIGYPGVLVIPNGIWHMYGYFTKPLETANLEYYYTVSKYDGTSSQILFTSSQVALGWDTNSSTPVEVKANGVATTAVLSSSDRILVNVYLNNNDNVPRNASFYTEGANNYSYIVTTLEVQGLTGPQGSTGPQGFQGPTGPQGDTGSQGFQGPTGPQGTNGTIGVNGATGEQGPTGPQGSTGTSGSAGSQGFQGPTGPAGTGGGGSTASNAGGLLYLFYNY